MAFISFLLLLTSSCVTLANLIKECPPQEDYVTCYCKEHSVGLDIHCIGIRSQEQLEETLHSLKNHLIDTLILEHVNATTLPTDLFRGLHVKDLALESFEVKDASSFSPARRHFSGLEKSLKHLKISKSFKGIKKISSLPLDHLQSLTTFTLEETEVSECGNEWYENGPKSLDHVYFERSGMEKLGDKAFASLKNLYVLEIYQSNLKEISRSMLPTSATRLYSLKISYGKIRTVPADMFSEMPALKYISLGGNLIQHIPRETYSSVLSNLHYLFLQENPLTCDENIKWLCNQTDKISAACEKPRLIFHTGLRRFCKGELEFSKNINGISRK